MKTKRRMSRWSVARQLQDMALRIAAGKPIRIGGTAVRVPDQLVLEAEVETQKGETELELELKWSAPAGGSSASARRAVRTRRAKS